MKVVAWFVFLAFIGVSAVANFLHGEDRLGGALMAVVPVGFAAVIFLLEALVARGKGSLPLYAAAIVVGGGAGIASYVGLATMALDHKVPAFVAYLLPLAYDGVVMVASLAIRGLGADHRSVQMNTQPSVQMNTGDKVFTAELNTGDEHRASVQMNAAVNTEMNTQPSVQMNTLNTGVQIEVSAVQDADEHPVEQHDEHPVEHAATVQMNTELNTEPTVQMNTAEPEMNTPASVQMNTPAEPVNTSKMNTAKKMNTPKAKPVNTDRAAELNTVRQLLNEGKSVRAIAAEMNISVGKVSGMKKEIEAQPDAAEVELKAMNIDDELAKLLAENEK